MALPGNPYDGHSLAGQIHQVPALPEHRSPAPMLIAVIAATRSSATASISPSRTPAGSPHQPSAERCDGAAHRAGHRPSEGRRPPRTKPPRRVGRRCDQRNPLRRRSQHAPTGPVDQASFFTSGVNHPRPTDAEPPRSSARNRRIMLKSGKFTGDYRLHRVRSPGLCSLVVLWAEDLLRQCLLRRLVSQKRIHFHRRRRRRPAKHLDRRHERHLPAQGGHAKYLTAPSQTHGRCTLLRGLVREVELRLTYSIPAPNPTLRRSFRHGRSLPPRFPHLRRDDR